MWQSTNSTFWLLAWHNIKVIRKTGGNYSPTYVKAGNWNPKRNSGFPEATLAVVVQRDPARETPGLHLCFYCPTRQSSVTFLLREVQPSRRPSSLNSRHSLVGKFSVPTGSLSAGWHGSTVGRHEALDWQSRRALDRVGSERLGWTQVDRLTTLFAMTAGTLQGTAHP